MPRRPSPNKKSEAASPLKPQQKKKRRSKSSTEPAGSSVLSADIVPLSARKPRRRVRKAPTTAVATGNPESPGVTADPPAMLSVHPAMRSARAESAPSVPADQQPSAHLSPSNPLMVIKAPLRRLTLSGYMSAAMTIATRWYRTSLISAAPHVDRLREIDWHSPLAAVLRTGFVTAKTVFDRLRLLSVLLLSGARLVNPRIAMAVVSFATFGLLLTRVSPESQTGKIPQIAAVASVEAAIPQPLPDRQQPEKSKRASAVAARMIDAPSRISSSCEKQAWPYVTASCLTVATDTAPQRSPAPAASPADSITKPDAAWVIPASTRGAQAMLSPDMPLSVDDDKPPRRREVAKRRHHEDRRHARTERKRNAPQTPSAVSQATAFAPLKSSNTPW